MAHGMQKKLKIFYEGTVYFPLAGRNLNQTHDSTKGIISVSENEGIYLPGANWYPFMNDEIASFDVTAVCPKEVSLITSGKEDVQIQNDKKLYHWKTELDVDHISLVGNKFIKDSKEVNGVVLSTYLLKDDAKFSKTYLDAIPRSSIKNLKRFDLKKERYDTIREGTFIFNEILAHIGTKSVITSSVGVREGVYLSGLLKKNHLRFPDHINPSIESILNRFKPMVSIERKRKSRLKMGSKLYKVLLNEIDTSRDYEEELLAALKLSSIGKTLTIYKSHKHAFYIAMQELNYGFTHKQMLLISLLLRMHGKELLHKPLFQSFKPLLPHKQTLLWLSFIYTLTVFLHEASNSANIEFSYKNKTLLITSDKPLYLAKEKIKELEKPIPFTIIIEDENKLPRNKALGV